MDVEGLRTQLQYYKDFRKTAAQELKDGTGDYIDLTAEIRKLDDAITRLHTRIWAEEKKIRRYASKEVKVQCPCCGRYYREGEVIA